MWKNFDKLYNYKRHLNRKKYPCKQIEIINEKITLKLNKITPKLE